MLTAAGVNGSSGNDIFATAVNNDNRMVTDRLSLPLPPMLPPPDPCPCLRRHHCCSLRQHHRPSNAPVNGWCCVVCCPSPAALSTLQICQPPPSCGASSTLFPLGCRPLLRTITSHCLLLFYQASTAFVTPVAGWLLPSPPAQQHNNHITKLKTFPVSTSWTCFDLLTIEHAV